LSPLQYRYTENNNAEIALPHENKYGRKQFSLLPSLLEEVASFTVENYYYRFTISHIDRYSETLKELEVMAGTF